MVLNHERNDFPLFNEGKFCRYLQSKYLVLESAENVVIIQPHVWKIFFDVLQVDWQVFFLKCFSQRFCMWCYGADIVHFPIYYSLGESKSTTYVVCYAGPQTSGPEMTKPFTDHPTLVFTPPLSCHVNVSRSSRCFSAFFYLAWKKKKWKKQKIIIYFLNFNWHNMGHPYSLPIMGFYYWSNIVVR